MPSVPPGVEPITARRRHPFRAALFDCDGTLSLFREGWVRLMVDLGCEVLDDPTAAPTVREFVLALNGRPTLFQMRRLAEEVSARGRTPDPPEAYLNEFLVRLMSIVNGRRYLVESGQASPEAWAVPGAHAMLRELSARGVPLYAASGSDLLHVRHELRLLGLADFFGPHVYAPADNTPHFSKADVVARILSEQTIPGTDLLGFGDGVVETREVSAVGGLAVGVASTESGQTGVLDWKRTSLIAAGADVIVGDYTPPRLVDWLFGAE